MPVIRWNLGLFEKKHAKGIICFLKVTIWCFSSTVSRSPHEPRSDSPSQRQTPRSGGQLSASLAAEAGRYHHSVQPAEAVEHHGKTGLEDHGSLTWTYLMEHLH